jgi:hypothetical protein
LVINENHWQSMAIFGNLWQSMSIFGNQKFCFFPLAVNSGAAVWIVSLSPVPLTLLRRSGSSLRQSGPIFVELETINNESQNNTKRRKKEKRYLTRKKCAINQWEIKKKEKECDLSLRVINMEWFPSFLFDQQAQWIWYS